MSKEFTNYINQNNMKRLNFFLMMCVICAGTGIGYAQDMVFSVEVKFRYCDSFASNYYLSEISRYGDVCFKADRDNPTTFRVELVGAGRYLIKAGARYLFATARKKLGFEFYTDDYDEANGYFYGDIRNYEYLCAVNAVRQNDALYVLGDEPVTDYTKLDELAQSGKVKKIDLMQVNNFVFSFSKYGIIEGKATYTINSDIGASVGMEESGRVKIEGKSSLPARRFLFFMENENNFDPDGPNYDGQFGENIHWELKDGTLTVSGTGPMSETDTPAPWGLYIYSVTNIVITNGITTVRASEFLEYANLVSITLPESLVSIGATAFAGPSRLTSVTVNWTAAEDLPAMGGAVFGGLSPDAVLHVPSETKAIYEAAAQWKDFKTIKEQGVTAQPTPIRNSQGGFNVSLAIPETGTFTATFDVVLPAKFRLNDVATKLAETLANRFNLAITEKGNGVWSFGITPKALRSASANPFREVVRVVYNVENTLEDGVYELKVKSLELKLADGTEIREDEIAIPVTFHSATGNEAPILNRTAIWSFGRTLYITTPTATRLSIFTLEGSLQKQSVIPAGETVISLPPGEYVIKAGAEVRKIFIW
jgi:hypothetical protein